MTVTAPDLRGRLSALLRVAEALATTWTEPGQVSRDQHALRVTSVRKRWAALAAHLDSLTETMLDPTDQQQLVAGATGTAASCPVCGGPVSLLRQTPNPRYAFDRPGYRVDDGLRDSASVAVPRWVFRLDPCLHPVEPDTAQTMWEAGLRIEQQPLDALSLVAAEHERIRVDRGRTLDHDEQLPEGTLSWAAWCIIDRAEHPDDTSVPASWPLDPRAWKPAQTRIRALTVAATMITSEIDRLLAAAAEEHGDRA